MTVTELIVFLQQCDPSCRVATEDRDDDAVPVTLVESGVRDVWNGSTYELRVPVVVIS